MPDQPSLYDRKNDHDSCGIGFVANIKNQRSHQIVADGLRVLANLTHRGAVGADPLAGDGAGLLVQLPHKFLKREAQKANVELPEPGRYGVGMVFLPQGSRERVVCENALTESLMHEGLKTLWWRDVPVDRSVLGESVAPVAPEIRQIFVVPEAGFAPEHDESLQDAFERKLYVARKQSFYRAKERLAGYADQEELYYVASLSTRTIVYKGMVLAENLKRFYADLVDPDFESALAIVHQRFSTNTFPSWKLAHPYRYLCHNGEINTVQGNINWMKARRATMSSKILGDDLDKLWPLIGDGASDSATFDNALELLVQSGYSLAEAMMLMIPEAWNANPLMDDHRRTYYEFQAAVMEPWDGPAAVAFTDGRQIGAMLDRNGLRPARFLVTTDDRVILASEAGTLEVPEELIARQWRLQPGKMLLIDLEEGRIIRDREVKESVSTRHPYGKWLEETQIRLDDMPLEVPSMPPAPEVLLREQRAFGYTREAVNIFLAQMVADGKDPIGAMGRDIPPAVLSRRPKMLYDYFVQRFAQVTNPPIDSIREESVMSLVSFIGPRPNLLSPDGTASNLRLQLRQPILRNKDLERVRAIENHVAGFRTYTLDCTYLAEEGPDAMPAHIERLRKRAVEIVHDGYNILILSDRRTNKERIAPPALLATSAIHHHLIREGLRTEVGLVVETGEAREVHDFCLLAGYGAEAINPYLAIATLDTLVPSIVANEELSVDAATQRYIKAINKAMLKVMAKMGISTFHSYCGAQIFDAVGLGQDFIDEYFTGTPSAISGVGIGAIARETFSRHSKAFGPQSPHLNVLDPGGELAWRVRGEQHVWTAETIADLQHACRTGDRDRFAKFTAAVDDTSKRQMNLRGLFAFAPQTSIPLAEVEPASEIVKRFATGAMSFGSISWEAHTNIAIAMNRLGGKSNTGEGGEEASRFLTDKNGDTARSAVKQVASGRFGVTAEYLVNADDIQIKIAQGAKPGEGGQLPGHKVNAWIARVRHATEGVGLISPPPHHDIYSIEDLKQLIHDLKCVNPKARISVKLVSEVGVGTIAAGVAKAKADHVLISGNSGGTGASPLTSIMHAGSEWELGLAEAHQTLVANELRGRIAVQVDGGIRTGRDIVIAALLGADEIDFATIALISEGCIMMRKCHLNTCPVGVATQDPELRKLFPGKPEHVVNLFTFLAEEVREHMARLGFRTYNEMIGRSDALLVDAALSHWKTRGLDFSKVLAVAKAGPGVAVFNQEAQDHGLEGSLDHELINEARPALDEGKPVRIERAVSNSHLSIGAMLSGEVARRFGHAGLKRGLIHIDLKGTAGQSFGAFLASGVTLSLRGSGNDYVGKGLSGGRIVIAAPEGSKRMPHENIIVGNTVLYGAVTGEAHFAGVGGERFAVRNSGAIAVVEGTGDHGCEYMTGGCVVILGKAGRNFAAGMSGGIAYVADMQDDFELRCNRAMVSLRRIELGRGSNTVADDPTVQEIMANPLGDDAWRLKSLITRHHRLTGSPRAKEMLENWQSWAPRFFKVVPTDYQRALESRPMTTGVAS